MPARARAYSKSARAWPKGGRIVPERREDRTELRRIHWAKTRALTFWVLIVWAVFSLLAPWFARELDSFSFLGFEFGYYLIVQGSLIVFVLLIVVQNLLQDRIDDAYGAGSID
jgi:putative solute:sodium symporter small subunit